MIVVIKIRSNEQFKKNQALFFGVEETRQVSRPQPVQTNSNQNYAARNPLGFGNVQTYQRPPVNTYGMPESIKYKNNGLIFVVRTVQDEWRFKKNAELFFA